MKKHYLAIFSRLNEIRWRANLPERSSTKRKLAGRTLKASRNFQNTFVQVCYFDGKKGDQKVVSAVTATLRSRP